MWNTTTQETGGKLPLKNLQSFLTLIGQRLDHQPERIARDVENGAPHISPISPLHLPRIFPISRTSRAVRRRADTRAKPNPEP